LCAPSSAPAGTRPGLCGRVRGQQVQRCCGCAQHKAHAQPAAPEAAAHRAGARWMLCCGCAAAEFACTAPGCGCAAAEFACTAPGCGCAAAECACTAPGCGCAAAECACNWRACSGVHWYTWEGAHALQALVEAPADVGVVRAGSVKVHMCRMMPSACLILVTAFTARNQAFLNRVQCRRLLAHTAIQTVQTPEALASLCNNLRENQEHREHWLPPSYTCNFQALAASTLSCANSSNAACTLAQEEQHALEEQTFTACGEPLDALHAMQGLQVSEAGRCMALCGCAACLCVCKCV